MNSLQGLSSALHLILTILISNFILSTGLLEASHAHANNIMWKNIRFVLQLQLKIGLFLLKILPTFKPHLSLTAIEGPPPPAPFYSMPQVVLECPPHSEHRP